MSPVQRACLAGIVTVSAILSGCVPRPAPLVEAVPHPDGGVRVSWTAGDPAERIVIQRREAEEAWSVIADLSSDLSSEALAKEEQDASASAYVDDPGPVRRVFSYRVATSREGRLSRWSRPVRSAPTFEGKPFIGWLSVDRNATCELPGVSDPHPIQCALAGLGGRTADFTTAEGPHVVYFPDGDYEVGRTLFLEGRGGVQLIGESPGGVVLRWTGPRGDSPDDAAVLFHAEGNRDATFRNFVWDGGCESPDDCFVVAFDQSFCGQPGGRILRANDCGRGKLDWPEDPEVGVTDNGGAHFDSVFRNAYVGLRLGHHGVADDTGTFRRCRFENNFAGVSLEDFNALHHWFWDPTFAGNHVGITNDLPGVRRAFDPDYRPGRCAGQPGEPACFDSGDCATGTRCERPSRWGGDFAVYRGRFSDSHDSDIWAQPTGEFIVRDSWSNGSARFLFGAGPNASRGGFSLIGNRVEVDSGPAIVTRTPGPFLLVDNRIRTGASGPALRLDALVQDDPSEPGSGTVDVVAVDNRFSSMRPYEFLTRHRLRETGRAPLTPDASTSAPPAPRVEDELDTRTVYTVTDARSDDGVVNARRIQNIIDAALADPRPALVHFPSTGGRYPIAETLRIPAGADLALVGDGAFTTLWWIGTPGEPVLVIDAASARGVTIRDLQFLRGGVVVENLERQAAPVLASQLRLDENGAAGLVLQELDGVRVDLIDHKASFGLLGTAADAIGNLIDVGSTGVAPRGVAVWSADTGRNTVDYLVLDDRTGARLLINGNYMEKSRRHLRIEGHGFGGRVTVHGGKLAPEVPLAGPGELSAATATVDVEDYAGSLDLLQSQMFVVTPDQAPQTHPDAVAHGSRVRVLGQAQPPTDIAAIGLAVRRQPTPGREQEAAADAPEFDFSLAESKPRYLRLAGTRSARRALPLPDLLVEPDGSDRTLGTRLGPAEEQRLRESLELVRAFDPPAFYDEADQPDPPAVRFDKVFVFKAPVALVLAAGTPCDDHADCAGPTPVCDREGIPERLPGRCRKSASAAR